MNPRPADSNTHPAATGMHAGTLTFTAVAPGSYQYLCPVPAPAQDGMVGPFTVR